MSSAHDEEETRQWSRASPVLSTFRLALVGRPLDDAVEETTVGAGRILFRGKEVLDRRAGGRDAGQTRATPPKLLCEMINIEAYDLFSSQAALFLSQSRISPQVAGVGLCEQASGSRLHLLRPTRHVGVEQITSRMPRICSPSICGPRQCGRSRNRTVWASGPLQPPKVHCK